MKKVAGNKGFTLVELIIVIAILAIIMLIAIPNFSGIQRRMQVRADMATAAQIGKATRIWYTEYQSDEAFKNAVDGAVTAASAIASDSRPAFIGDDDDAGAPAVLSTTQIPIYTVPKLNEYVDVTIVPKSLLNDDKVPHTNQQYYVGINGTGTATKIVVGIGIGATTTPTPAVIASVPTGAVVNYTGDAAGIAYVEP